MSAELYPYIRPLAIKHFAGIGLPSKHLRKEEVLSVLEKEISKSLAGYEVDNLFDLPMYASLLFEDFVTKNVLREEVEKFAGSYWRFNSVQMKSFAGEFPKSDSISQAASRIGSRFYPDVFDGFRAQNGITTDGSDPLVPKSVIAAQDWSSIADRINAKTKEDIRSKVQELIETIRQSDLDDRLQANALKRAESVALLLEAPDPPWEVVVDLLNNRYLQAFLSALTIIQLIIGLAS